jgi:hypothetical protein
MLFIRMCILTPPSIGKCFRLTTKIRTISELNVAFPNSEREDAKLPQVGPYRNPPARRQPKLPRPGGAA